MTYILRATNFYSVHKNPTTASKKPKRSRKTENKRVKRSLDHIDRFFAGYPKFNYSSSNPIWTEFNRMRDFFDWDRDDEEDAKRDFKAAMVKQFNDIYGTDPNNLENWQKLCHVLNIEPAPTRLKACREVGLMASTLFFEIIRALIESSVYVRHMLTWLISLRLRTLGCRSKCLRTWSSYRVILLRTKSSSPCMTLTTAVCLSSYSARFFLECGLRRKGSVSVT